MRRIFVGSVIAAALFAAFAGSAWAQEEAPLIQFGARASVVAHSTYELDDGNDDNYGLGFGFGVGLVLRHNVSDALNFRGEPSLYWRSLYGYKTKIETVSVDEMALCLPLTANYFVSSDIPIFLSGGFEIDLPFNTFKVRNGNGTDMGDERAYVDVGFLVGGGYMIKENIGVDARYVVYFNSPRNDYPELLMSYGICVFVLF